MFKTGTDLAEYLSLLPDAPNERYKGKRRILAQHVNALFRGESRTRVNDELFALLEAAISRKISDETLQSEWLAMLSDACLRTRTGTGLKLPMGADMVSELMGEKGEIWLFWPWSATIGASLIAAIFDSVQTLKEEEQAQLSWFAPDESAARSVAQAFNRLHRLRTAGSIQNHANGDAALAKVRIFTLRPEFCGLALMIQNPRVWKEPKGALLFPNEENEVIAQSLPSKAVSIWRVNCIQAILDQAKVFSWERKRIEPAE